MKKLVLYCVGLLVLLLPVFSFVFFRPVEELMKSGLDGVVGLVDWIFQPVEEPVETVPELEVKPAAVNGGGYWAFNCGTGYRVGEKTGPFNCSPSGAWYVSITTTGSGYQYRTVSSGISFNASRVKVKWHKGSNYGDEYDDWSDSHFRLYRNGSYIAGSDDVSVDNVALDVYLGEGSYTLNVSNDHCYWWDDWTESVSIVFYIDWTAPELVFNNVTSGGLTNKGVSVSLPSNVGAGSKGRAYNGESITVKYSRNNLGSGMPGSAGTSYTFGQNLTAQGHYVIQATDSAGNVGPLQRFTIDTTKPENNFTYALNGGKAWTSKDIEYNPTDNYALDKSYVKFNDGVWVSSQAEANAAGYDVVFNGNKITVPKENPNGEWYFKASDTAGNFSDEYCVVLDARTTFGNKDLIYNSFKENSWYNVVLPNNIFGVTGKDIAGTYHLANYDAALRFAIAKEWEYRVSPVQNGWVYVAAGNSNLAYTYTDRAELDSVVEKYAKGYIRERSIAKNGNNVFGNIVNDDLLLDNTALTRQFLEKPDFLTKDLPVYFMNQNYKFVDPKLPYATYAKIQMVANDYALVDRTVVPLEYEQTVASQIFGAGNNSQGYYLVTEWDDAGNLEEYYVYIDLSAPSLVAAVRYGNDTTENVTFDETLVNNYNGTFRYVSLDMREITDRVDHYVTIKINGRKLDDVVYIQGDELPVLDGAEYYGKYTIELYDRSGNTLQFTVSIAGQAPYMTHTSLTSDISCRLTLNIPDNTNAIRALKLYYITYEGVYTELSTDHAGVTIDAGTLQYTLTTGGKYTMWYEDIYGRTAYCPYVFYLKGLPTGTLSGVSDGGITNRNVTLRYSAGNELILYKIANGQKTVVALDGVTYARTFDETSQRYTATIMANEETTASYVWFLYKAGDMGLFVEYSFSIDCIIAPIYLYDTSGRELVKNGWTNKPFYCYWNETVTLRYYTDKTPGGEMGAVRYIMGTKLGTDGTYYFTLKDTVGNTENFTIMLDSVVSYSLEGDYVVTGDHSYLAKNDIRFLVTERTAVKSYSSTPDVVSGGLVTLEGVYTIWITDAYENSVEITITIDLTPPEIELDGVATDGTTNSSVTVHFVDYHAAYLVDSREQILANVADYQVFDQEGTYRIKAVDLAGNAAIIVFAINRTIPFESNTVDGAYTTAAVTFNFIGPMSNQIVMLDQTEIALARRYTQPGVYAIYGTDKIGNSLTFRFTILPSKVSKIDLPDMDDYAIVTISKDGYADGTQMTGNRLVITENGKYQIKLKNTKNDTTFEFTIEIDNYVNGKPNFINGGLLTDAAKIFYNETVTQTVVQDGAVIKVANEYSKPGQYTITATDEIGNVATWDFTILPKRTREINLAHLEAYELLLVTKDGAAINAAIQNDELHFTQAGNYMINLRIKGTTDVFAFAMELDNALPQVDIKTEAGSFITSPADKPNCTAVLTKDGVDVSYRLGKRQEGAGHYVLTVTDELGNTNTYTFDIREPMNWASWASIVGIVCLVALVLLGVWLGRRRYKVR